MLRDSYWLQALHVQPCWQVIGCRSKTEWGRLYSGWCMDAYI